MMGLWNSIASGVRNVVQAIPGGSQAFPLEANGTVNWVGNPVSGGNVLGAAVRGATGLDAAESVADGVGGIANWWGNRPATIRDSSRFGETTNAISQQAAQMRPGSVVGRGFIGSQPSMGLRPGSQRNALGYRVGQAPGVPANSGWQMPGTQGAAPATAAAGGRSSGGGSSGGGGGGGGGLLQGTVFGEATRIRGRS